MAPATFNFISVQTYTLRSGVMIK